MKRMNTISTSMKCLSLIVLFMLSFALNAQKNSVEKPKEPYSSSLFSGIKFRSIGPAFTSGRIADFAVNPDNSAEYYVAAASGHVWKTINAGTTWTPVFDNYGAYSIGCLTLDPGNKNVLWVGTGEKHSQRALGYGDGVYKSDDGGGSFKNMGLKSSRQIGKILVDPRNSDVVYVAAEGSTWGPGGERGVYKTTDGGKTWLSVLTISENTGVDDLVMDPGNPDVLYTAAHQRRRHVYTKIDGGPESAIYKTNDAGKTWNKLSSGLPSADMGSIGLAISPINPDVVYAIIEAANEEGGFFRSTNRGASWEKMNSYQPTSPQYYNKLFCDPAFVDKIYAVDTYTQVSTDGGKTFRPVGNNKRHVDDHVVWIDPKNTKHLLIGGDGGVFETYDEGANYQFKSNLPVTQFYRVAADNTLPFYYVYGGTQDNNSVGGPSRNTCSLGVVNDDWFVTCGGDGFWSQIDPVDPDIVYAESQYGGLVRYDRKSGEAIFIQPMPGKDEYTYRWNWDSPLIISPHSHTRIYFAANKLFRSDDRGNTWQVISDDLTQQIDRNKLPVMGKIWSVDAVAKNGSTSLYGTIVALDESPIQENLLYVGTDDGLLQVTEDGGKNWRKVTNLPGVPQNTYVSDIFASRFDANTVYACFNNIKNDDFKPYVLVSNDKGKTWKSISSNLPINGTVHTINQDFVDAGMLFIGTEFGFFISWNGGTSWTQLKGGLPVIPVRDIVIQQREYDLVLATFGRGFYILDNYSFLRELKNKPTDKDAYIFNIKDALMYIEKDGKDTQGSTYFTAKNPDFGAVVTWFKRDTILTLKEQRKKREEALIKSGQPVPYPSWDELRLEDNEASPYLLFTIYDSKGRVVRKLTESPKNGINRTTWDLRYQGTSPVKSTAKFDPLAKTPAGIFALPGNYTVSLSQVINGVVSPLTEPIPFKAVVLNNTSLPAENRAELEAFQSEVADLAGSVMGASVLLEELKTRTNTANQALLQSALNFTDLMSRINEIDRRIQIIDRRLNGDFTIISRNENPPTSLLDRLNYVIYAQWASTSAPTQTQRDNYLLVKEEYPVLMNELKSIATEIQGVENEINKTGGIRLPGTIPQ